MDESIEWYICKTDGFSTSGFPKHNEDSNEMVRVHHGDIVQADSKGYLWKDGICLCHKESILGHYHFRKNFKKIKRSFYETGIKSYCLVSTSRNHLEDIGTDFL